MLRCRNATQTSVVLEWDVIQLATADLRSLTLFRNNNKAGAIPRPLEMTTTKISGLAVDTEYTFHLLLRTSAGAYTSEKLPVRTHKMTDLSGITVTPGVLPGPLRASLTEATTRIGARMADTVRIDTTHFVCTEGRGREWERALDMNIPVVRPEWIEGCEREGRLVGVRGYYLNADPRLRQIGQGVGVGAQQHPQGPGQGSPARTNSSPNVQRQQKPAPIETSQGQSAAEVAAVEASTSPVKSPPERDAQEPELAHSPVPESNAEDESKGDGADIGSGGRSLERRDNELADLPVRGGRNEEGERERQGSEGGGFSEVEL